VLCSTGVINFFIFTFVKSVFALSYGSMLQSGPHPAVVIWEAASLVMKYELKSHQHGVACIAFSPDGLL